MLLKTQICDRYKTHSSHICLDSSACVPSSPKQTNKEPESLQLSSDTCCHLRGTAAPLGTQSHPALGKRDLADTLPVLYLYSIHSTLFKP